MLVMDLIDSHFYLLSIEASSLPLQASLLKEREMDLRFEKQMKLYKTATTATVVHHVGVTGRVGWEMQSN